MVFEDKTERIPRWTGKKDQNGREISLGDILENKYGTRFEVRFGTHAMYCPVDDCMMENVGFYVVAEGYYEDMPLGPTEEYAVKIGNVSEYPELRVKEGYRCQAELKTNGWIPCSEKIPSVPDQTEPENCPEFNVTIKDAKKTTTLKCDSNGTWFDEFENVYQVIAWQPLPEAYQEEITA